MYGLYIRNDLYNLKCKLYVNDSDSICIDLYYFINLIYLIYRKKIFFLVNFIWFLLY